MVSYCNAATVQAMFGARAPPGPYHPHHHHSPPQHYFPPNPYGSAGPHPTSSAPPAPYSSAPPPPPSAQNIAQNFPVYESQWGMTPTESSPPSWASTGPGGVVGSASSASSSCIRGYDEWHGLSSNPHYPHPHHPHHHPMMGSFYPHPHHFPPHHSSQPSPPTTSSSTPSPPPPPPSQVPSASYNNNNNNNHHAPSPFKSEFGTCSSSAQERASSEMGGGLVHSPDSGMAVSDGVSSSGSPHIPQQQPSSSSYTTTSSSCLGGPSSTSEGSSISSLQYPTTGGGGGGHSHHHTHHSHRPTQARSPYEWMKKPSYGGNANSTTSAGASSTHSSSSNAKTRTKDKYRVVYSDTQRLELEKEFHYSRYITIRRKSELASILGLSERQVKIWFQNRRAKERKIVRKREELMNREKLQSMAVQFGGMM